MMIRGGSWNNNLFEFRSVHRTTKNPQGCSIIKISPMLKGEVKNIKEIGGEAISYMADVRNRDDVKKMCEKAVDR